MMTHKPGLKQIVQNAFDQNANHIVALEEQYKRGAITALEMLKAQVDCVQVHQDMLWTECEQFLIKQEDDKQWINHPQSI